MSVLRARIQACQARVVVVGAGYVGLPLAVETAAAGFPTVAFDKSAEKVRAINEGVSYIKDIPSPTLAPLVLSGRLTGSTDPEVLAQADAIVVCVPTPLNKTKDPDNSFIMAAADLIASRMRPQQLIVVESTTFPGFTREVLMPKLGASGFKLDRDFFLAFSPERVDPGNTKYFTKNTPKVIGGSSPASLEIATALYHTFVDYLIPVSSTDAAEMVKLLENTFRAVNIGLVNEVAIMCHRLDLDVWEVIEAAATKPFGFMPFFPGPGLGGHCIPIDPLYLSWKLKTLKYNARFIELADEVNSAMPDFVVQRIADALNDHKKALNGSRILLSGITYKRDVDDIRESPAFDVIGLLQRRGAQVDYYDPYVPRTQIGDTIRHSTPFEKIGDYDCVVIVTDHRTIDYPELVDRARLVVDCRNATRGLRHRYADKIVSL
ncbi:MAG: nucleotide sugar dehydrogenase [Myxococcales bacterium]